jgi:hypothetical protein
MMKSHDLIYKVSLLVIGMGVGSFCTIAKIGSALPIGLRVDLAVVSVAALFVGLFFLRASPNEDNQPSSPEDSTNDNSPSAGIETHPSNDTTYHQGYAKPLHSIHIFVSLLRNSISHRQEDCQSIKRRISVHGPVFSSMN